MLSIRFMICTHRIRPARMALNMNVYFNNPGSRGVKSLDTFLPPISYPLDKMHKCTKENLHMEYTTNFQNDKGISYEFFPPIEFKTSRRIPINGGNCVTLTHQGYYAP